MHISVGLLMLITIGNDGQDIVSTNYFESEYAVNGKVYMSINAGAFRLLLPDSQMRYLEEMSSGKEVLITLGKWLEGNKRQAFELLFEDYSMSPFCLYFGPEQIDRIPNDMHRKDKTVFTVWTTAGKVLSLPCYTRRVDEIPCLEPWCKL